MVVQLLLASIYAFLLAASPAQSTDANRKTCTAAFDQPTAGANVRGSGTVTGRVTNPAGTYAWVLARLQGLQGAWPQGGGPVQVKPGEPFRVHVTYGAPSDSGPFEVFLVVVDPDVNTALQDWVAQTNKDHEYPPVNFPNVHDGCPVTTLVVNRQ